MFGNVGTIISYRVGVDDAEYLVKQFEPVFSVSEIINIDNYNAFVKMLANGKPVKPFNMKAMPPPPKTDVDVETIKRLSYQEFGRDRYEIEGEIMKKYQK